MKTTLIATTLVLAGSLVALPLEAGWHGGQAQFGSTTQSFEALSPAEEERLQFMREEEKLARDVYLALFDRWGQPIFDNISKSEQRHMDAMKQQIDRYGVEDPVTDDTEGVFVNDVLAGLYQELLARGDESLEMALRVGAYIEEIDILDLERDIAESTHEDLIAAYENLMRGSRNHLRAFVRQLESMGIVYEAVEMEQAQLDEIVDSPVERGGRQGRGCRGHGCRF